MQTARREIWECDETRTKLWDDDPKRAAMLAYLEVVALWHDQVERGIYWGIPALHRIVPSLEKRETREVLSFEPATTNSRPSAFTPDESASQYVVPVEIRERWQRAA